MILIMKRWIYDLTDFLVEIEVLLHKKVVFKSASFFVTLEKREQL